MFSAHARVINGLVYNAAQIPVGVDGKIVGTTIEEQTVKRCDHQQNIALIIIN